MDCSRAPSFNIKANRKNTSFSEIKAVCSRDFLVFLSPINLQMLVTDFRVQFSTPLRNIRELMHVYWWCFIQKRTKFSAWISLKTWFLARKTKSSLMWFRAEKKTPLCWEVHENYVINENKDRNESTSFCRSETSTKQDIQLFHGSQAFRGRLKILHTNKKLLLFLFQLTSPF